MTDTAITVRSARQGNGLILLEHYSAAALTAAAGKYEWVCPVNGRITDVICDSAAANSGDATEIIDVNINGTTIYTIQGNRPTLPASDTGMFAEAGEPEVTDVRAGDIISYDVDQIATTGSTRFKILIVIQGR